MMENLIHPGALFLFLSVGAVALFSFIAVASWANERRLEREAYYKADMLKKISETAGPGADVALQLYREDQRATAKKRTEDLRTGGLVLIAVGLGLYIFLHSVGGGEGALSGVLPFLIGVALLASSFLVKRT